MGILPVSTFCSGHTFFVQRMADVMGLQPYVVHATFQFSGTPGKRHRMRESLLWDAVSLEALFNYMCGFQSTTSVSHVGVDLPGNSGYDCDCQKLQDSCAHCMTA